MAPAEKLLAGARLFDYACEITKAGIRAERPDLSEEQVARMLIERLALARRLEAGGDAELEGARR